MLPLFRVSPAFFVSTVAAVIFNSASELLTISPPLLFSKRPGKIGELSTSNSSSFSMNPRDSLRGLSLSSITAPA
jgi:hypothetical protein